MISAVSSVHFGNGSAATSSMYKNAQELIESQGAYTKAPAADAAAPEKKKGGFLKKAAKLIAGIVVVAGAMVAANKFGFKVQELATDAGFFKKGLNYLAKGCEWVTNHTYEPIAKGIGKLLNKAPDVEEII